MWPKDQHQSGWKLVSIDTAIETSARWAVLFWITSVQLTIQQKLQRQLGKQRTLTAVGAQAVRNSRAWKARRLPK